MIEDLHSWKNDEKARCPSLLSWKFEEDFLNLPLRCKQPSLHPMLSRTSSQAPKACQPTASLPYRSQGAARGVPSTECIRRSRPTSLTHDRQHQRQEFSLRCHALR
jgi:hypothetical protein